MNCPVCGSEIPSGVKYCPVCGTDVEEALLRNQAASSASTQQMPPQRPVAPAYPSNPPRAAVPMNSSMPSQAAVGRDFDTSKMGGKTPKWPIIVICALLVVIVVVVLLIFQPWNANKPASGPTSGTVVSGQVQGDDNAVQPVDGAQGASPQDQQLVESPAASAGLSDAEAFAQLTAVYDQFSGFENRVQSIVDYFNTAYPDGNGSDDATRAAWLDGTNELLADLGSQADALNAVQLAEGSAYAQTLQNLKVLNNDLVMRTADLADALQAWINGEGSDAVGSILTRNNDGGVSVYKSEYEALYPNARPVQL